MTFVWILLFNFAPSSALNAALQSFIYRLIKLVISINLGLQEFVVIAFNI